MGADWWGGIPPCTNIDNVWWHLPDKYVNQQSNYFAIGYSAICTTYVKNENLLTNTTIPLWYVNGQGGACSFREMLHFSNGQSVNIAAAGHFTVYRPSVTFPFPTNFVFQATPMLTNGWLELGNDNPQQLWMEFNALIRTKASFSGVANWTQLVNRDAIFPFDTTCSQFWLDNSQFYNSGNGLTDTPVPPGAIPFEDNPGVGSLLGIDGFVTVTDQFKTYLVFKPDGDSIWITLGIVTWGWSASEDWWMFTGSTVINPGYSPSDDFPVWPRISYNTKRR